MKTLVIYYSHSGNTRKLAQADAAALGAQLCEIKTARRLGIVRGVLKAIKGKTVEIAPLTANPADYELIKLYAPIWAGSLHPAANAAIAELPSGKSIEVTAVSASGKSNCQEQVRQAIAARGSELAEFRDTVG